MERVVSVAPGAAPALKCLARTWGSPHDQVERAGFEFWIAQRRKFRRNLRSYNVVVAMKPMPIVNKKFVYQVSLNDVAAFIENKSKAITPNEIEEMVSWLY